MIVPKLFCLGLATINYSSLLFRVSPGQGLTPEVGLVATVGPNPVLDLVPMGSPVQDPGLGVGHHEEGEDVLQGTLTFLRYWS